MKVILKKTPLYESFDFDSDEDFNFDEVIESHHYKKFLEENYDIKGIIRPYKKDGMLFIDVDGNVIVKNKKLVSLTNGKFRFGTVKGNFDCHYCDSLKTLKGAPEVVGRNFECDECKSLISLKGAPNEVGGGFYCKNCASLTTLEGAPNEVGGGFDCNYCESLISLEGAPSKVGGSFDCSNCNSLIFLKGAPEKVGRNFYCGYCYSLKSIDLPTTTTIKGKIYR